MMKLKEIRIRKDVTQVELAKVIGVSSQTILNWENEIYKPNVDQLIQLADYFNVSIDYLVGHQVSQKSFINEIVNELEKINYHDLIKFIQRYLEDIHQITEE